MFRNDKDTKFRNDDTSSDEGFRVDRQRISETTPIADEMEIKLAEQPLVPIKRLTTTNRIENLQCI